MTTAFPSLRVAGLAAAAGAAMLTNLAIPLPAHAQPGGAAQWKQIRPSNTGIPGVQLHYSTIAPDGRIWVAGRWPFWGEGGYGIYDPVTGLWETLSNVDTPQPSQWAREVIFAPNDVIWMATDDGLVRKQGENWTVYTAANSPLLHNKIRDIALAPDGKLWINNSGVNTSTAALFSFDGSNWSQPYQVGNQIPFATPWYQLGVLLVTPDNRVWVGNYALSGLAVFDGTTWSMRGQNVDVFSSGGGLIDLNGHLWMLGESYFWRYRPQENVWDQWSTSNTPFAQTSVTKLAMDSAGRVYSGNWMGQVIRFDGSGWTQVANVGDAVVGISVDAGGEYWIATLGNGRTGELHHLDASGNRIHRYNTWNTGTPDYFIERFNLDPEGNMWLASGEGGLSRFDGQKWRNWGNHNSGSEPYPFAGNEPMGAFYMDRAGIGWMGGNGIARWNRSTGEFNGFWNWQNTPTIGSTLYTSFAEDAAGNLFAASKHGYVLRFDGNTWISQPPTSGSYTSRYAGVKADPQGRVWSIGWLKAFLWDGSTWREVGHGAPGAGNWNLFDMLGATVYDIAPDGTLYIGTGEGLMRIENPPAGPITIFTPDNSPLPAKQVQGIDIRHDGVIAVSTHLFQATTPFPTGVAVINGDPETAANWQIYKYGQDPIPHYQLGPVKWDVSDDLWISAISEGCTILSNPVPNTCYANCDGSTLEPILNVDDFTCFINEFAAAQSLPHEEQITHYANCDGSTAMPVLNVDDFTCFINAFAAGCP